MDIDLKYVFWIGVALLCCALISILALWFGSSVEELQLFAFPVFSLGLFFLLRKLKTPSSGLMLLPLGIWLLMSFSAFDFLTFGNSRGMQISHLSDDPDLEEVRVFLRNYKKFERRRKAAPLNFLDRDLGLNSERESWLSNNPNVSLLISGNSRWLELFPRSDYLHLLSNTKLSIAGQGNSTPLVFRNYVDPGVLQESMLVKDRASGLDYLLLKGPRSVALPTQDQLLAFSFISWFGKALNAGNSAEELTKLSSENESEIRNAYSLKHGVYLNLRRIVESHGLWASNTPRGFISYLLGTSFLLKYHELEFMDELDLCVEKFMGEAAARVGQYENPELYVAIYNNAAVGKILSTRQDDIMTHAKNLLWKAANTRGRDGRLVKGTSTAYSNLLQLERSAAVSW